MAEFKQELRKVTLLKEHTHAGVDFPAGSVIELKKEQAEWLCEIYVAERIRDRKQIEQVYGRKSGNSEEVK